MREFKRILFVVTIFLITGLFTNSFAQEANKPNLGNNAGSAPKGSIPIAEHFDGGKDALLEKIQEIMVYPPSAKRNRRQGECIIHVTLQEDGTIENAKIVKEIGAGTGAEALRIVKSLKFNAPGYIAEYSIPVKFHL